MKDRIQIIPAVLATTEKEYQEKIEKVNRDLANLSGWVQIDLMDGKFVNNKSVSLEVVAKYPTKLKKEAHLMVKEPIAWIEALVKLGMERITIHQEASKVWPAINLIKSKGIAAGLALSPQTAIGNIEPFLDTIDEVLLMGIFPGFGGQSFLPQTLAKVKQAVSLRLKSKWFLIGVDGGIDEIIAKDLAEAGADNLIIGERLIYGNFSQNFQQTF